jgi:plasmid stabilization system protein ParE
VAEVRLAADAVADLDQLIATHGLPYDTKPRVRRRLSLLTTFPESAPMLPGREPARGLIGPWSWMLWIYRYDSDSEIVEVARVFDIRTSAAPALTRS